MKKLIVYALSALMLVSLVACKSGKKDVSDTNTDTKDTKVTIKLSGLLGGYGDNGFKAAIKLFEEKTGHKVELQLEKNIADVLRPTFSSGENLPDIVYYSIGATDALTEALIAENQLEPLDDILNMTIPGSDTKVSARINDAFLDSKQLRPYSDGKLYLLPIFYSTTGLFYNKGLFKEHNLEVPKTTDELLALADKAKELDASLFTYPTTGYFDTFFSAVLNSFAGPSVYAKLMNYDLESWKLPEVKAAFEFVGKLAENTYPTTVANANGEGFKLNQQLVLDNKALLIPNGFWLPGEMADAPRANGFEWGMMPVPSSKAGGDAYSSVFTEQIWIPKNAQNKEVAKEFIAFLYSPEATKAFYESDKPAVIPVKDLAFLSDSDKPYYNIFESGVKANLVGFAAHEAVEGVNLTSADGILYGTINSVVSKDKTVEDWYNAVLDAVSKYQ